MSGQGEGRGGGGTAVWSLVSCIVIAAGPFKALLSHVQIYVIASGSRPILQIGSRNTCTHLHSLGISQPDVSRLIGGLHSPCGCMDIIVGVRTNAHRRLSSILDGFGSSCVAAYIAETSGTVCFLASSIPSVQVDAYPSLHMSC